MKSLIYVKFILKLAIYDVKKRTMRYLIYTAVILLLIVISFFFASDRLSYNNCMAQTKSDYISEKGAEHVSAQCKAFILEKVMVK